MEKEKRYHREATLEGKRWNVFFDGAQGFIKDRKAVRYIFQLLENPNMPIRCTDLQALVSGRPVELNKKYAAIEGETKNAYTAMEGETQNAEVPAFLYEDDELVIKARDGDDDLSGDPSIWLKDADNDPKETDIPKWYEEGLTANQQDILIDRLQDHEAFKLKALAF